MTKRVLGGLLLGLLVVFVRSATAATLTLTWNWSQGTGDPADGFHIQSAPGVPANSCTGSPGTFTALATVIPATVLTYADTTVVAGQARWYRVAAFNASGDSAFAGPVCGLKPLVIPTPPTGLTVQ